jgi:hypothetical protein
MKSRRSKPTAEIPLWVTVRDEDTGELLNYWSFRTSQEAQAKKIEQEEALDPPGRQTRVDVEHVPVGQFPAKIRKR